MLCSSRMFFRHAVLLVLGGLSTADTNRKPKSQKERDNYDKIKRDHNKIK